MRRCRAGAMWPHHREVLAVVLACAGCVPEVLTLGSTGEDAGDSGTGDSAVDAESAESTASDTAGESSAHDAGPDSSPAIAFHGATTAIIADGGVMPTLPSDAGPGDLLIAALAFGDTAQRDGGPAVTQVPAGWTSIKGASTHVAPNLAALFLYEATAPAGQPPAYDFTVTGDGMAWLFAFGDASPVPRNETVGSAPTQMSASYQESVQVAAGDAFVAVFADLQNTGSMPGALPWSLTSWGGSQFPASDNTRRFGVAGVLVPVPNTGTMSATASADPMFPPSDVTWALIDLQPL